MIKNDNLLERTNTFLDTIGVPNAVFSRQVDLSTSALYRWRIGDLKLSQTTLSRIDRYLKKYNF